MILLGRTLNASFPANRYLDIEAIDILLSLAFSRPLGREKVCDIWYTLYTLASSKRPYEMAAAARDTFLASVALVLY